MYMDLKTRPDAKSGENNWNSEPKKYLDRSWEQRLESPEDLMISENSEDILVHWQGPEYEIYPKDQKWYLITSLLLLAIIAYALITDSPIMAITFILIGIVGYIYLQKDPRVLSFAISREGVYAGKEIYDFEKIESFWMFYEAPHTRILSLKMREGLLPYIHIPIHQEDPDKIRKALLTNLPEKKHTFEIIDTLERLLHI